MNDDIKELVLIYGTCIADTLPRGADDSYFKNRISVLCADSVEHFLGRKPEKIKLEASRFHLAGFNPIVLTKNPISCVRYQVNNYEDDTGTDVFLAGLEEFIYESFPEIKAHRGPGDFIGTYYFRFSEVK